MKEMREQSEAVLLADQEDDQQLGTGRKLTPSTAVAREDMCP